VRSIKNPLRRTLIAVSSAVALFGAPTFAHHSFGRYDMAKQVAIEGQVVRFEWSNPHCWLFVDVEGKDGKRVTHGFEMSSVGEMLRRGWVKTSLKAGERVKVDYRPLRDGTPGGLLMSGYSGDGKLIGNPIRGGGPDEGLPAR
jgi:hypothetical protein